MKKKEKNNNSMQCPKQVAIIGGGRWARVLTEVLYNLVPPSVEISVHSLHNASSMIAWSTDRGFGHRIRVSSEWPQFQDSKSNATIIANAARDHEGSIEKAFAIGSPVLVEKPVTLSAAATLRLISLAQSQKTYFAAAHIFLFARYIENFYKYVAQVENIQSVRVNWTDPKVESRYGEVKHYDPSLPIFADCLPHILSIMAAIFPEKFQKFQELKLQKGGAHLDLKLDLDGIPCDIHLMRNGPCRKRLFEITTHEQILKLDFSTEPGTIVVDSNVIDGDSEWKAESRPVASMLLAFLQAAVGGEKNSRLDVELGLKANQVIDQVFGMYQTALMPWLLDRLASSAFVDDDMRYALSEVLQFEGTHQTERIEHKLECVRQYFFGRPNEYLSDVLASKPAEIIRSIAR